MPSTDESLISCALILKVYTHLIRYHQAEMKELGILAIQKRMRAEKKTDVFTFRYSMPARRCVRLFSNVNIL